MKTIILVLLMLIGSTICTFLIKRNEHQDDNEVVPNRRKRSFDKWVGKWPNGVIPYVLDPQTKFTTAEKTSITNGMATIMGATKRCVKFVSRTNQKDYLFILGNETGCWSYIGKRGGKQPTSLNRRSCLGPGAILHELAHVVGMIHEHQRPDRDKFVKILWNNVLPSKRYDYALYYKDDVNTLNQTYDYNSVTHYRSYSHNTNASLPTIIPLDTKIDPKSVGPKTGVPSNLTSIDIAKIMKFYGCS